MTTTTASPPRNRVNFSSASEGAGAREPSSLGSEEARLAARSEPSTDAARDYFSVPSYTSRGSAVPRSSARGYAYGRIGSSEPPHYGTAAYKDTADSYATVEAKWRGERTAVMAQLRAAAAGHTDLIAARGAPSLSQPPFYAGGGGGGGIKLVGPNNQHFSHFGYTPVLLPGVGPTTARSSSNGAYLDGTSQTAAGYGGGRLSSLSPLHGSSLANTFVAAAPPPVDDDDETFIFGAPQASDAFAPDYHGSSNGDSAPAHTYDGIKWVGRSRPFTGALARSYARASAASSVSSLRPAASSLDAVGGLSTHSPERPASAHTAAAAAVVTGADGRVAHSAALQQPQQFNGHLAEMSMEATTELLAFDDGGGNSTASSSAYASRYSSPGRVFPAADARTAAAAGDGSGGINSAPYLQPQQQQRLSRHVFYDRDSSVTGPGRLPPSDLPPAAIAAANILEEGGVLTSMGWRDDVTGLSSYHQRAPTPQLRQQSLLHATSDVEPPYSFAPTRIVHPLYGERHAVSASMLQGRHGDHQQQPYSSGLAQLQQQHAAMHSGNAAAAYTASKQQQQRPPLAPPPHPFEGLDVVHLRSHPSPGPSGAQRGSVVSVGGAFGSTPVKRDVSERSLLLHEHAGVSTITPVASPSRGTAGASSPLSQVGRQLVVNNGGAASPLSQGARALISGGAMRSPSSASPAAAAASASLRRPIVSSSGGGGGISSLAHTLFAVERQQSALDDRQQQDRDADIAWERLKKSSPASEAPDAYSRDVRRVTTAAASASQTPAAASPSAWRGGSRGSGGVSGHYFTSSADEAAASAASSAETAAASTAFAFLPRSAPQPQSPIARDDLRGNMWLVGAADPSPVSSPALKAAPPARTLPTSTSAYAAASGRTPTQTSTSVDAAGRTSTPASALPSARAVARGYSANSANLTPARAASGSATPTSRDTVAAASAILTQVEARREGSTRMQVEVMRSGENFRSAATNSLNISVAEIQAALMPSMDINTVPTASTATASAIQSGGAAAPAPPVSETYGYEDDFDAPETDNDASAAPSERGVHADDMVEYECDEPLLPLAECLRGIVAANHVADDERQQQQSGRGADVDYDGGDNNDKEYDDYDVNGNRARDADVEDDLIAEERADTADTDAADTPEVDAADEEEGRGGEGGDVILMRYDADTFDSDTVDGGGPQKDTRPTSDYGEAAAAVVSEEDDEFSFSRREETEEDGAAYDGEAARVVTFTEWSVSGSVGASPAVHPSAPVAAMATTASAATAVVVAGESPRVAAAVAGVAAALRPATASSSASLQSPLPAAELPKRGSSSSPSTASSVSSEHRVAATAAAAVSTHGDSPSAASVGAAVSTHPPRPSTAGDVHGGGHANRPNTASRASSAAAGTSAHVGTNGSTTTSHPSSAASSSPSHSWGLSPELVALHKRRLMAFYAVHAPAKAKAENVASAFNLFGPNIWIELERKYSNTEGFRPPNGMSEAHHVDDA